MKQRRNSQLVLACAQNDYRRVRELLDPFEDCLLAAQPNVKTLHDWSPLHVASSRGHFETCQVLLCQSYGVDINAKTSLHRTALHLAALHGHFAVLSLLVSSGALLNEQDVEGNTPLHCAATSSSLDAVRCLLEAGADRDVRNCAGMKCWEGAGTVEIWETLGRQKGGKYARTPFESVMRRSSRIDMVSSLLHKCQCPSSVTALRESSETSPPPCSADFSPISLLGRGSFGEVYLSQYRETPHYFALKVIQKSQVKEQNLNRYIAAEHHILTSIRHPFLLAAKCAFQTKEKLVLVEDFCPGGDLAAALKREKRLSEERTRKYAAEVLLAIEELHNHDIAYRDLKPENVLLTASDHILLSDFGLSKLSMTHSSVSLSFCGTSNYFAPEILARKPHTRAVDCYHFGLFLYTLMVGKPPFYSHVKTQMYDNIEKTDAKLPKCLSEPAKDLIRKLLVKDPEKRLGVEEIKQHQFFQGVEWKQVATKGREEEWENVWKGKSELKRKRVFGDVEKPDILPWENWSFISAEFPH